MTIGKYLHTYASGDRPEQVRLLNESIKWLPAASLFSSLLIYTNIQNNLKKQKVGKHKVRTKIFWFMVGAGAVEVVKNVYKLHIPTIAWSCNIYAFLLSL